MATTSPPADRLVMLDVVRGFAVMGIFSVNVIGMAMIQTAYFTPTAYGFDGLADQLTYAANFLLVDGKLRSLFSIIFGASALLVIQRASASGRSPARTHFARMAVLLLFGLAHFYFLWWGDILAQYALIGMIALLFRRARTRTMLIWAAALLLLNAGLGVARTTPEILKPAAEAPAAPPAQVLAEDAEAHETIAAHARHAFSDRPFWPFFVSLFLLPETLGLMLLGMAGFKAGFFSGSWSRHRYRQIALWGLGTGLLVSAVSLHFVVESDFAPAFTSAARNGWTVPIRPVMAFGYAALLMLLFQNPGALRDRFAAVGRTAFTNYLGCTLIGTAVFFGFAGDLYGDLSRAEAWLLVPPVWAAMLLWSKPWLDRFQYGPFEWLWRSLARGKLQPMRRGA